MISRSHHLLDWLAPRAAHRDLHAPLGGVALPAHHVLTGGAAHLHAHLGGLRLQLRHSLGHAALFGDLLADILGHIGHVGNIHPGTLLYRLISASLIVGRLVVGEEPRRGRGYKEQED